MTAKQAEKVLSWLSLVGLAISVAKLVLETKFHQELIELRLQEKEARKIAKAK